MWINGTVIAEEGGMVRLLTDDGIEISVPASSFVDEVEEDLCEIRSEISKKVVETALSMRNSKQLFHVMIGSRHILVQPGNTVSSLREIVEDIKIQKRLGFVEKPVVVCPGDTPRSDLYTLFSGQENVVPVLDALTMDGETRCAPILWSISNGSPNLQIFPLTVPTAILQSNLVSALRNVNFAQDEVESIDQIVNALNRLSDGLVPNSFSSDLGIDPEALRILLSYQSNTDEEGQGKRLTHSPLAGRAVELRKKSLRRDLYLRLVDYVTHRINRLTETPPSCLAESAAILILPSFNNNSSITKMLSKYFFERINEQRILDLNKSLCLRRESPLAIPSISSLFTRKSTGAFHLLNAECSSAEPVGAKFAAKFCACNMNYAKRGSSIGTFLIPHSDGDIVEYNSAELIDGNISKIPNRDVFACFAESSNLVVRKFYESVSEQGPKNRRSRFTLLSSIIGDHTDDTSPQPATVVDSAVASADQIVRALARADRVWWLHTGVTPQVVETVTWLKKFNGRDIGLLTSVFASRYRSVEGFSWKPDGRGIVWLSLDEERRLNKCVESLMRSSTFTVQAAARTWLTKSRLRRKIFSAIKLQRWIRVRLFRSRFIANCSRDAAEVPTSRRGLYRELLKLKNHNSFLKKAAAMDDTEWLLRIARLEASNKQLETQRDAALREVKSLKSQLDHALIDMQSKDHLVNELTNSVVRSMGFAGSPHEAEQGFLRNPHDRFGEEAIRLRIRADALMHQNHVLEEQVRYLGCRDDNSEMKKRDVLIWHLTDLVEALRSGGDVDLISHDVAISVADLGYRRRSVVEGG